MGLPDPSHLEVPILEELRATGEEHPSVLFMRLLPYFPQICEEDLRERVGGRLKWKLLIRRAGRRLIERGEIERLPSGRWRIKEKGRERVEREEFFFQPSLFSALPSHDEVKGKIVEIGRLLGKYAVEEYERYDVVWKDSEISPRISHVFEVQDRGSLEGALTKLKHAYDTQRSKPFIVLIREKERRVRELIAPYLSGSFHEIGKEITILTYEDIDKIHRTLSSIAPFLGKLI